jgi:hypothetical protein
MNNQRRRELANIITSVECVCVPVDIEELEGIKSDIEMVLMDEEMAYDSMPENLQGSYRGIMSEEAQDNMNEAIDLIDEFISDYEDYETDQIHDSEDDESENEEDIKSEIEDKLQDLISEVVEYLEMAAE